MVRMDTAVFHAPNRTHPIVVTPRSLTLFGCEDNFYADTLHGLIVSYITYRLPRFALRCQRGLTDSD